MPKSNQSFLKRNGLSLAVLALMLLSLVGQYLTGWQDYNSQRKEWHKPPVSALEYVTSGHFISATFENWESEFLQMAIYVLLTVSLYQKGSSESKDPEKSGEEEVDREPKPHPGAPWPVRKGGLALKLYNHSLSIVLTILFLLSFYLHLVGSLKNHNEEDVAMGKPASTMAEHLGSASFWFESFQNWQSEFLSVLSIVVLSIWLRQKGSPESKPVDAPHSETGG
jgi:hypothetical protein